MDNIVVITQNVILHSLEKLKNSIVPKSKTLVVSTQFIFENEVEIIDRILECKCQYVTFSELLNDEEMEACDRNAFNPESQGQDVFAYYEDIKILKNKKIIKKINELYPSNNKYIVCDDLGVYIDAWLDDGYIWKECSYYHTDKNDYQIAKVCGNKKIVSSLLQLKRKIYNPFRNYFRRIKQQQVYVAKKGNIRYLFYGNMNRIAYRLNLNFRPTGLLKKIIYDASLHGICLKNTIRLSTLHEGYHKIPDREDLNYKLLQDGYLPPNYGSNYLYFYGKHTEFYTWDILGQGTFDFFHLPSKVAPIRKKLYLPEPRFPQIIKKVLCVASGAGDWTAIKNRSDEDKMVHAFGKIAALYPNVEFVYRCHPVWVNPKHQGVNSIKRVAEYIEWLNLPNMHVSANIPDGSHCLSFKRSSLEEDLKNVDIVFGEHSVGMIDGALKKILFASVNLTGRRNLFKGISDLGFPHCESVEAICGLLDSISSDRFREEYLKAIGNYNEMTDKE